MSTLIRLVSTLAHDQLSTENETLVHNSARFFVEYQQMEQRLRLDIPTLADPVVRDLLQESDLFVRSFNGMGGFGLLSPFDFVHILALLSELFAHIWVLMSLTGGSEHMGALVISLFSALLPLLLKWCGFSQVLSETRSSRQEARTAERQEKLRSLAYSDFHRPEIILFGLGPWILKSWATARKTMLGAEHSVPLKESGIPQFISQINVSDLLFALQNVGLVSPRQMGKYSREDRTDPLGDNFTIFIGVSWLVGSIQKLYTIGSFYCDESHHHHTDGISRCFPHGRLLRGYENTAAFKASEGGCSEVQISSSRCSN